MNLDEITSHCIQCFLLHKVSKVVVVFFSENQAYSAKKSINQEYEIRYTIPEIHKSNSEYSTTRRQDSNIIKNFTFVLIKSYSLLFPVKFFSQGKPCFHYRDPCNENRVLCNENRVFPLRIDLQGVPCKPYRVWVCS